MGEWRACVSACGQRNNEPQIHRIPFWPSHEAPFSLEGHFEKYPVFISHLLPLGGQAF